MRLSRFERRALLVVFDAILPAGAHPKLPLGAGDVPMLRFFDDAEVRAPFEFLLGLRAALFIIWLAPIFLLGKPRTFGGLSPEDRMRVLRGLQKSPIYAVRELPNIAKTVACLAYCGLPEVQAKIGLERIDTTLPSWVGGER